jgi:hypothetical protein
MAQGNDREAVELAKCAADYPYFIDTFGVIDDAQGHGDGGGMMRFRLWAAQVLLAWQLMTHRLVIILKARQLGISWLCCGYALWHCLFGDGKLVLLYSQGELEAIELLRRIKAIYGRLPEWMRESLPSVVVDNTTQFNFSNGSRIQSLPATAKAGRSNTASLVIVDEAAFLQWADKLYTALKPTIDGGGQLIILSTANGLGNLFHRLWIKASAGLNNFKQIFLPWWSRPGRDPAWYASQVADATDSQQVKQEYPANANEAFVATGRVRFDGEWISKQAKYVLPGIPRKFWPESLRGIDGLTIYQLPLSMAPEDPGHLAIRKPRYLLVADVAEGLEHGDFSAAVMLDDATWDEIIDLHGHWEPDVYAHHLHLIAEAYDAGILVERNNHGHSTLSTLKALKSRRVLDGPDGRPGWLTNAQTKPQSIDAIAIGLRDDLARFHTQAALDELQIYRVLPDGGTGAPAGYHDDRVMCRAIALGAIKMGIGSRRKMQIS